MPSDNPLVGKLRAACVGHPNAKIPWPHRILHEAASEIERLEAANAALMSERTNLIETKRQQIDGLMTENEHERMSNAELFERAFNAEARGDRLAEALRPFIPDGGPAEDGMSDDAIGSVNITVGMLRRARTALSTEGE